MYGDEYPIDDIEEREPDLPENFERGLALIGHVCSYIYESERPDLAALGVAFAMDEPSLIATTMSEEARKRKVSKAAISKHAVRFCEIAELPPSRHMQTR